MTKIKNFFKDESGVSAVEYALMAAFVAITLILGIRYFYTTLSTSFNNAANAVKKGT